MSVSYQSILGYGYIFSNDSLDVDMIEKRILELPEEEVGEYDLYGYYFPIDEWGRKNECFVGIKLEETNYNSGFEELDVSKIINPEEYDKELRTIIELLNIDVTKANKSEPHYYLVLQCR